MAIYAHTEALQSSIRALSSDGGFAKPWVEALELAFAEEIDAVLAEKSLEGGDTCGTSKQDRSSSESDFSDCESKCSRNISNVSTDFGSEDSSHVLEALEDAEAEALEFERQESGCDEDRIDEIRSSVATMRFDEDMIDKRSRSMSTLSQSHSIIRDVVVAQSAAVIVHTSPVIEALEDALAEEIEFKRMESSSDEEEDALPCRVAMLTASIRLERAALQVQVVIEEEKGLCMDGSHGDLPKEPQYLFSQPGLCDCVAALEEAEMEAHEAFIRQASGEDDDHIMLLQDSIATLM
jgi:hypothetical protein